VTPVAAGSDGMTLALSQVASALAPTKGRGIFRVVAHSPPSSPDVLERHDTLPSYPGLERRRLRRHRRRVGRVPSRNAL